MRTPDDWKEELKNNGLEAFSPLLLKHWLPCLRLHLEQAGDYNILNGDMHDEVEIGNSKMGGYPDLPSASDWPTIENTDSGNTLAIPFLAQIRLEEIAELGGIAPLPSSGLLSFFFDFTFNYEAWKVLYFADNLNQLSRVPAPANLVGYSYGFPRSVASESPCRLNFEQSDSLPSIYESEIEAPFERIAEEIGAAKKDDLYALMDKYQRLRFQTQQETRHQLLGHDDLGFGRTEAAAWWQQQEEVEEETVREWRLLLQLDQDIQANLSIGCGAGVIGFFIRDSDLNAANFDNVYASYLK